MFLVRANATQKVWTDDGRFGSIASRLAKSAHRSAFALPRKPTHSLTLCAQQPEGIQETTHRPTVADIAGPHRMDADREVSHGHYPADEIDVPGFDDELARRDIVQGQRNVLFYLVSRPSFIPSFFEIKESAGA
jgi:hypothetical protein